MSPENAALRSTLRARRLHGGFFGRSAKRHALQYNITHTHTQGNFNMFRIPRRISDTLHAAPYAGGFVVSLFEALLTSTRRQVGEWGITAVEANAEYDHVQFTMYDSDFGISYRVTVEPIEHH